MKLRKQEIYEEMAIVGRDLPHYFEVKIPNHPNGVSQMHVGQWRDVESVLERYPDATVTKIFPPNPPQTVNVSAENLGQEEALKEAVPALPESELEEFTTL